MSNLHLVDMPVTIRAETSINDPDTCKFIVSSLIHPGGPYFFTNKDSTNGSPLVERLFQLPGVVNVLISDSVITICKNPIVLWPVLKAGVGMAIRTQLMTGVPSILDIHDHGGNYARTDSEIYTVIQNLLDKQFNPSIANHGGSISIVKISRGRLFISMSGGCQGCSSSQITLRQGLEVMLKSITPEITEIVDTTDHAAGKKPFYQNYKESL